MGDGTYKSSSGQCAYPSDLDCPSAKAEPSPCSGQCAYPSDLDYQSLSFTHSPSSGQCAYPSDLDSDRDNFLITKEVIAFRALENRAIR